MGTKKDVAVSFLRLVAPGRVREAYADHVGTIVRFEGDRIVELWDIGQPVPAESVNANGMF